MWCVVCAAMRSAFGVFDSNGDGRIEASELAAVIASLKALDPSHALVQAGDVDAMIRLADTDGNGTYTYLRTLTPH